MFWIHQQHQAQIPVIELYIDFKEVTIVDDKEEEPESGTFPEREVEWEQNISENDDEDFECKYGSGDDGADDDVDGDVDDKHLSSIVVAS